MNSGAIYRVVRVTQSISAVLLVMAMMAGCSSSQDTPTPMSPTGGPLIVVATTTQIRSMAEALVRSGDNVRSILPPGVDAHDFEPKPSDVQTISESALVLKNGAGLDDWVDKLITNAGGERPLVVVSEGVQIHKGDKGEPGGDPHIWFDVTNAMTMTRNIRDALIKIDPPNSETYKSNADNHLNKLAELDKYIMDKVANVPSDKRKIVTNHDAFGYFIRRYGLTYVGSIIPSMSTDAQPSASDVAELIQKIEYEHVKAIFLESSINPDLAKQIGNDAGVKVVDTLYGDSLGEAGTPGATYESMMRYNTDTIVSALK